LVPFLYFGIADAHDLRDIPWRRGRGYDVSALSRVLIGDERAAGLVVEQVRRYALDPDRMRALGFCVSVDHARFMAEVFVRAGIPAVAVWGESSEADRRGALSALRTGETRVVFSVDLFNEGVDVPDVDTLLLLRPTESATLFLQQLGRGLRRAEGKAVCTVLDFVANHRREFRFDRRFRALVGGSRQQLLHQVERGFPFLPAGCAIDLDPVARQRVLQSLRQALPAHHAARVDELRALAAQLGRSPTLGEFLPESGLDLTDIYSGGRSWSDLIEAAGLPCLPVGEHEVGLRRACGRLLHVDDLERIDEWIGWLEADTAPVVFELGTASRRRLRGLLASLFSQLFRDRRISKQISLVDGVGVLWAHPQVRAELVGLLRQLRLGIDHVHRHYGERVDVPLRIHARYTRLEILAACADGDAVQIPPWQTGVRFLPELGADLLAFTIDKSSGGFSPTTRYRDYAISPTLIHWESQSVTRADSETGMRYRQHASRGSSILLFARERADDRAFWFLGPATYVQHESERPMRITWRLSHPLPSDLFTVLAAAQA
jgi:hypothetical protein